MKVAGGWLAGWLAAWLTLPSTLGLDDGRTCGVVVLLRVLVIQSPVFKLSVVTREGILLLMLQLLVIILIIIMEKIMRYHFLICCILNTLIQMVQVLAIFLSHNF